METLPTTPISILERFNRWIQESIMIKLFSIGFLILILLIPSKWITDLIYEREERANEAAQEVADKWSGPQTVYGPMLVVPYRKQEIVENDKHEKQIRETIDKAFFLPEQLQTDGTVDTETRGRGIFNTIVYSSNLKMKITFGTPDFKSLSIADDKVLWNEAYMVLGLSDLRGIRDTPDMQVGGIAIPAEPSNDIGVSYRLPPRAYNDNDVHVSAVNTGDSHTYGIVAKLNWASAQSFKGDVNINLKLKGSTRLNFLPTGKTTSVKLTSPWQHPSFDGEFLPDERKVSESGFVASWKVLHFNRPFSQQWTGTDEQLNGGDFGVKFLIPVDQYQMTMRTSKYSVLIILLTFVALFLVEMTQKIRIHPFQYILVGAALIIYYTLLLSLSEQDKIGFHLGYIIASGMTVALISFYSLSFLRSGKLSILFSLLLIIFYSFIFVIILQQDFSLLLGSIGLFLIVGLLMYFSRKINWYNEPVV
ncbi:cell envelope integrity protein CreD [Chryseolinea lacunae]|uniref:Cell envelope integrity protein CreD n=1 Tax=Chryseolinea lacunae TaxID=2801331 RepID=A0ABS1KLB5_9BACT|nr:cell envelope integrity protein CreD [Chryseolinea lacunae]MBL0740236.1 cell envelope integrity protein CreD [Chryseolinea lacunae]